MLSTPLFVVCVLQYFCDEITKILIGRFGSVITDREMR